MERGVAPASGTNQVAKRVMDLAIALILAIPALLVCAVAMIFVYAEMGANPIFSQQRVGLRQRPFTLYKMRTMPPATPDRPSHEVGTVAVTPTGRILRRFKIDELPQLWCVLRGDMSLVGPRPCLPSQVELIAERAKRGVFEMPPGITGPAQVQGIDMSQPLVLAQLDAQYAASHTIAGDLKLLLQTVLGHGRGDAAA
jgi:lipopolysaccharide/colanic/teichoic acid biosynthesis glycosyltransferase